MIAVFRGRANSQRHPAARPKFPRTGYVSGAAPSGWRAQSWGELFEDMLRVAFAAQLDRVFRADHHHIVTSRGASSKAMAIVAAVGKVLERRVEGKAMEGLQFFDR